MKRFDMVIPKITFNQNLERCVGINFLNVRWFDEGHQRVILMDMCENISFKSI